MKSIMLAVLMAMMLIATVGCENRDTPLYITPTTSGKGIMKSIKDAPATTDITAPAKQTAVVAVNDSIKVVWTMRIVNREKVAIDSLMAIRVDGESTNERTLALISTAGLIPSNQEDLNWWYENGSKGINSSSSELVALGDSLWRDGSKYPYYPVIFNPFVVSTDLRILGIANGVLKDGSTNKWSINATFLVRTRPKQE